MKNTLDGSLAHKIKVKALEAGFDICGIARARSLSEEEVVFKEWLAAGMNDKMGYLKREPERRFNPALVFPGAKSLVVAGISYGSEMKQTGKDVPVLSRYTYGIDYHEVVTGKLRQILVFVNKERPGVGAKAFCDTGTVHEKTWIREAGIGWQGRNSLMINKEIGSFFFIGILILDIELDYDKPETGDFCGSCRMCIDACPTAAIHKNRTIDARKCISNLTIENRGPVPEEIVSKMQGRVYGCDICQEVCPWNLKTKPRAHTEFTINQEIALMKREDWLSLTEDEFKRLFGSTSVKRIRYNDFKRNIYDALRSLDIKRQEQ
ncbi:MAG TPA: tRNA epoxyqueuosine(34) reductase QueG [Bacteroidales bacterium]|nr:tRNA epoxyqueuosine(34) reductase QueG [Bacteroidales bacterium]HPR11517.1 tRNA epoxyqueuosine(34) reductase QueG [Bacteroidales bacterium]HRW84259.1 tRNA epoxyqueuosine(34) reductase QueG [Bacteroidales bacterium]